MEGFVILILILLLLIIVLPIVALTKAGNAEREVREALKRIRELESRVDNLQRKLGDTESFRPATQEPVSKAPEPLKPAQPPPFPRAKVEVVVRTEIPVHNVSEPRPPLNEVEPEPAIAQAPPIPKPRKPAFSIEQFLGVKMFAWLGGVALFFGVIFFVKYAFEHNLIPPAMRVAIGFIIGVGMLAGGVWTHRMEKYRVPAQSLCATGVLILYGVSYAAHAVYHFPAFGPVATFALMGLITVTAFLVSIRFDALVVAVLGMLGGFLTPVLLPMVQDHPFALFSYIALLDAGLIAVTFQRARWTFLTSGAAACTVLTQWIWVFTNFHSGRYFQGGATLVPMGIFLFFAALLLAATWWKSRDADEDRHRPAATAGLLAAAMLFGFFLLGFKTVADRTFLSYGYVLLINLGAIGLAWIRPRFGAFQTIVTGATFLHLVLWTMHHLRPEMLGSALAVYLVLGGMQAVWPVLMKQLRPDATTGIPSLVGGWMAPLTILLMSLPLFVLPQVSFILWPAILLANLLAIGLAVAGGSILPVIAALASTLFIAAAWLLRAPSELASLSPILIVVVFFAMLFTAAGVWLGKKRADMPDILSDLKTADLLTVASCGIPFLLLILMVVRLPVANPSPVFGAALLLVILLLGLAVITRRAVLAPAAVLCCLALEGVWHSTRFHSDSPVIPLTWYLGFYALFTVFPFAFRKLREDHTEPWVASALAGAGSFLLVHSLIRHAWPNGMMGFLPAAFAIPSILSLLAVIRTAPVMDHATQARLSWLGGVALLFITLIFPIQFDRQWLTVSWALEGACLVWLFRRVPHSGLLWTGLALLAVSFARLTLNPAVLSAYPRSGTAIFNWHLYTYGIVAAAMFLGARLLPEARRHIQKLNLTGILHAMGGVLLFLLLNIEIADFFTVPGRSFIAFDFGGNFARDMTYTIGWGLFALALLVIGIWRRGKGARFAAIGLLVATLLKLFLHDLANIDSIFRIAALIATGLIAFIASFLYQRFFTRTSEP